MISSAVVKNQINGLLTEYFIYDGHQMLKESLEILYSKKDTIIHNLGSLFANK